MPNILLFKQFSKTCPKKINVQVAKLAKSGHPDLEKAIKGPSTVYVLVFPCREETESGQAAISFFEPTLPFIKKVDYFTTFAGNESKWRNKKLNFRQRKKIIFLLAGGGSH
jgi:hypothetical protein